MSIVPYPSHPDQKQEPHNRQKTIDIKLPLSFIISISKSHTKKRKRKKNTLIYNQTPQNIGPQYAFPNQQTTNHAYTFLSQGGKKITKRKKMKFKLKKKK